MVAGIAVSAATFAIDKLYSYRIPEGMALSPGCRVQVPFGRGNTDAEGIVVTVGPGDREKLKEVLRALDQEPMLSPLQLKLAAFLRERYFCTFYDAARAMLPAGLWFKAEDTYSLTEDRSWETANIRKEGALLLLTTLRDLGGACREPALSACIPEEEKRREVLTYLAKKKWITARKELLQKTRDRTERIATLAVPAEEAMAFAMSRPKGAAMQRSVLKLLCSVGSASVKDICYYTGASAQCVSRLQSLGYVELGEKTVLRCREIPKTPVQKPLVLNREQEKVFAGLSRQARDDTPGVALLYGVTGSGKTSVYIRLIEDTLARGRSAILMVPEIALTPQLLGLMSAWFDDQVAVLHSSLSAGERYDQWKRVRAGQARVIVGTRSAVFAPCENLGLVILDEEQEHSYKSENAPRYAAREVAMWRGVKEGALVVLGSATPSVESMYHARRGDYTLYTLQNRYNGRPLPEVTVVDMREELKLGNDGTLSYPLRQAIHDTLRDGKQVILLLNRRGNARALVCVDCRETPECPRCSERLTYHSANNRLMCHYCGFSQPVPQRCPKCGGPLKTLGTGTQRVQQELSELFPEVQTARMDADTVSAANPHEAILSRFRAGEQQILLGTQMVAKGLDLPNVTLVGVLDGDLSLFTGGFRAGETTFDLLTLVVGRAGRGAYAGRAMIQTMAPNHELIRMAARQDYESFYELEIRLRQIQNAPPFLDCVTAAFQGRTESQVLRGAAKFRDSLLQLQKSGSFGPLFLECLGPAPSPVPKINYQYRYRLTVHCRLDRAMRGALSYVLTAFGKDREMRGVNAYLDVNGFEM